MIGSLGHVQLTETGRPDTLEVNNMAALRLAQRAGVGRALMAAAGRPCNPAGTKRQNSLQMAVFP